MFSLANVAANNGVGTALSGILIVYMGLVLIAVVIYLFNLVFRERSVSAEPAGGTVESESTGTDPAPSVESSVESDPIPEDDLIAIAALIELYRRVHFDRLQSQITFVRGQDAASAWQLGYKYGQRKRF